MKRINTIGIFAAAIVLAAGTGTGATEPTPQVLSDALFAQMDSNKDGQVSTMEYVGFGTTYLKKKGKQANRAAMEAKFAGFDRNGDGFITADDPEFKSPQEVLEEKIAGSWLCEKTKTGSIEFVFMEDGQADVIQNGESMREKAGGKIKYRFVRPSRTPTCLDIIVDRGTDADFYIKCIVQFISEDRMKLRMISGSAFVVRPRDFPEGGGMDTAILDRIKRPEKAPVDEALADEKQEIPKAQNAPKQEEGVHLGMVTAKVKVKKDSDKTVESSEKEMPVGTLVTTTTKRIEEEIQILSISVANQGPKQDTFELCWYFLCRLQDGSDRRVYDKGTKTIVLNPRQQVSHSVVAEKISVVEQTVEKENEETGNIRDPVVTSYGEKVEGFVVLLKHGDTILDKKSHDKNYLTNQWLSKL
jgi:hypothetical protein